MTRFTKQLCSSTHRWRRSTPACIHQSLSEQRSHSDQPNNPVLFPHSSFGRLIRHTSASVSWFWTIAEEEAEVHNLRNHRQTCWSYEWNINAVRVNREMRWGRVEIWILASNWQTNAVPQWENFESNDQSEGSSITVRYKHRNFNKKIIIIYDDSKTHDYQGGWVKLSHGLLLGLWEATIKNKRKYITWLNFTHMHSPTLLYVQSAISKKKKKRQTTQIIQNKKKKNFKK